ncbi:hypothetical protein [Leptospira dzoumogneensis]|uniref:DUF1554 domain-containing protein n=1 Tax=Leptospira dzoumogneensis TaxID=2484904 RepID=A0A4Z1B094_9LEPT|nr:hypothetical protein [Leptospira dzoumogneensis]TGN03346.1 hypothetical protein EHR06_04880 [Leptospira dzoumogneensis]
MKFRTLTILFFCVLSNGCISDKICSDQDRSCSPVASLLSLFSAPSGIYVYSTSVPYGGNLSIFGAGNLDSSLSTICKQERPFAPILDVGCESTAALVSTSLVYANNLTSLYADIPTNIPMRGGPTGTILADDLASFFTLDLHVTLEAGGLGSTNFWTYSDVSGNYASGGTCNDGIDNTTAYGGYAGSPLLSTVDTWFNVQAPTCDQALRILCICYRPDTSGGGG